MLGLNVVGCQLRRHRFHTLALDGQDQPRAVVAQRLSAISVIHSLFKQRHILIETLLASGWRWFIGFHRFRSAHSSEKRQFS